MKELPVVPEAVEALLTTGTGGWMTRVRFCVPVPATFVALKVTVEKPVVVGVPEITPVLVFTLKPSGRPVASKLSGLPVAVVV